MQQSPGVVLSAASAAVSLTVVLFVARRRSPGARGVALFGAAAALWAGGNAVQLAATTLSLKLLAVDVQYVGIVALPIAWVVFAAEYTGREEWVNRRTVGALCVVPVALLALVATNDAHHLVRTSASLDRGGTVRLVREFGPAFWIAVAYSNVVNAVGTVLLIEAAVRVQGHYRRQTAVVLAGATVPWVANVAYLGGATDVEPEAFLGVTALAFGYAIARYELLDLVPVARDRVLEELDDGVLVVDGRGRIADHNAAADRLLGVDLATGAAAETALPPAVRSRLDGAADDPVRVDAGDEHRWVSVRTGSVDASAPGRAVVLRDVTELERRRRELDRTNARLERVADTISHDLRNPLAVAEGYLDRAEERGDPEDFERVRRALGRMDDIVEGTLRMARADRGAAERERVALADAAWTAWERVPTDGATLSVEADGAAVLADPDQLGSLLENVFRNAVEHGAPDADEAAVTVGRLDDGFYVADDGPGIPPGEREAVFGRGYSTSGEGTGLGLAIVRDVAAGHGWDVSLAESAAGGVRVEVRGVAAPDGDRAA